MLTFQVHRVQDHVDAIDQFLHTHEVLMRQLNPPFFTKVIPSCYKNILLFHKAFSETKVKF